MKKYFHLLRRLLAKCWLDINLQLTVVGVTGSYGKTSTVRAVAEVLSEKYSVNRTALDLDTVYNLPITLLKTKIWNEILVLEYGVDHIGEMDKHLSLVKPKIAVLTGITPVHADKEHFGSLENIIKEKRRLVESLPSDGLAVFNFDDETVRGIGKEYNGRKIFYGLKKEADIRAEKVDISLGGTVFVLQDDNEAVRVETGLLGYPAVSACLAAWAVGEELKVEKEKMLKAFKKLGPSRGRFSVEPGPMGTVLINDALRANLASTLSGLKSFAEFSGRKVAILGEMGEIGEAEEEAHRKIGRETAKSRIDILVGVGPLAKFTIEEAKKSGLKDVYWAENVQEAAEVLKRLLEQGDLLYLKASLLRHLERVIMLLGGETVNCKEVACRHYSSCAACSRLLQL